MRLKGRATGVTLSPPRGGSVAPPTKVFPCEPFPRSPLGSQNAASRANAHYVGSAERNKRVFWSQAQKPLWQLQAKQLQALRDGRRTLRVRKWRSSGRAYAVAVATVALVEELRQACAVALSFL